MKELPKVFRNEINKNIDNNKKVYYSQNESSRELPKEQSGKNVQQKINENGYMWDWELSIQEINKEDLLWDYGIINLFLICKNKCFTFYNF